VRLAMALIFFAGPVTAAAAEPANQSFFGDGNYANIASIGLVTTLGPTGLFQNPTSGITPKNAFSVESCMAFKENNGDHFQANGVLATYGVTDWLEIGGYGLFVHGLDPAAGGDSTLKSGNFNMRARLVRELNGLPEITIGGIASFGDDPLVEQSLYVAASKGFTLNEGQFLKSARLHGGIRESWPDLGDNITTAFVGLEVEIVTNLFVIGDVNTRDRSFIRTPWSAGLQYKSSAFGFSAAVLQDPNETRETYYVGIGVSY
jgi:hypothetical protein